MILHTAARVLGRTGRRRHLTQARFQRIPVGVGVMLCSTWQPHAKEAAEVYEWTRELLPGRWLQLIPQESYACGFNPELSGQVIFAGISTRSGICPPVVRLAIWTSAAWRAIYVPAQPFKNENCILYVKEWPRSHRVRVVTDDQLVACKCSAGGAKETIIRRS